MSIDKRIIINFIAIIADYFLIISLITAALAEVGQLF